MPLGLRGQSLRSHSMQTAANVLAIHVFRARPPRLCPSRKCGLPPPHWKAVGDQMRAFSVLSLTKRKIDRFRFVETCRFLCVVLMKKMHDHVCCGTTGLKIADYLSLFS